tara:strand:- start:913 stop:1575 length:663 start_codon:yes stop_codon:yes gene_type:complete
MKKIKENNFCDFFDRQPEEVYEKSHSARLDFLVEDLSLGELSNSRIADFGCGYGCTLKRMPKDKDNLYFGWDGYENKVAAAYCDYRVVNFDNKFADDFLEENEQVDVAFCFETIEHVQNPYNMLYEIKKILKPNGILYLTIPHEKTTHNTIYPSLIYPSHNFDVFLSQMAFEINLKTMHDKDFVQVVYGLQNKGWDSCKMIWYKEEEKFRNIPPHIAINT